MVIAILTGFWLETYTVGGGPPPESAVGRPTHIITPLRNPVNHSHHGTPPDFWQGTPLTSAPDRATM